MPFLSDMAILLLGTQVTFIITFFLSRNIRIARQRAWDQTVASRGKGPDFWQPYVEEWDVPPIVDEGFGSRVSSTMSIWAVGVVVKKGACMRERTAHDGMLRRYMILSVVLFPLSLYPFVGTLVAAGLKAMGTARHLHKPVSSHLSPITTLICTVPYPLQVLQSEKNDTPRDCSIHRGAKVGLPTCVSASSHSPKERPNTHSCSDTTTSSIRFYGCLTRRHPGHWTRVYRLEQDRRGHVGTRYVPLSPIVCVDRTCFCTYLWVLRIS